MFNSKQKQRVKYMSNIQKFANNQSTQFAKLLTQLCIKHCNYHPVTVQQYPNFHNFKSNMYTHRVLYAFYKLNPKRLVNMPHMQAAYVKMLRNNPKMLVNIANTPTAYI